MTFQFQGSAKGAKLALVCFGLALLASCRSAMLDPFRTGDYLPITDATSAMTLVKHRVKPATAVTGKRFLSLEDCRAMALRNNLDLQAARLEEVTKEAIRYSSQTRLLPHFIFSGDLSERDNQRFAYSEVLGREGTPAGAGTAGAADATGVTNYSYGHERSTWYYVLETRWSPTDAALAYYVTKSGANDRTRAHYQKLRVAQKLTEIVDAAFCRLLALQESLPLAENLVRIRSEILRKGGQLLEERLARTEDYARAEQKAARARRLLSRIRNDIEVERNTLASAMALSPDYSVDGGFQVVGTLSRPVFNADISDMEMTAVRRRPEAYDAGLSYMNSVNDVKRTIVKYFPKISGYWRYACDKDKYLYNKNWKEVGISIYFDFVEWLANVDESKASQFKAAKSEREMGAVALGITSQVRVAALKYFDGMEELQSAETTLGSLRRVVQAAEARLSMQDVERLVVEEVRGDLLEAKVGRMRTLGEVNATLAALQSSMGTNYNEPMSH